MQPVEDRTQRAINYIWLEPLPQHGKRCLTNWHSKDGEQAKSQPLRFSQPLLVESQQALHLARQ